MRRIFHFFTVVILLIFSQFPMLKPDTAHAAAGPVSIAFHPYDSVVDPKRPVIYLTKLGSKTIYSVNYETGDVKTLILPYAAEKIEMYNDKLYVTQLKTSHNTYNMGPYSGAIAEVNANDFTLIDLMEVATDPYDIAIDKDGIIYISPGSGQWENIKAYSLLDKTEIPNGHEANVYERSTIYYSAENSKIYTIDSTLSPRDIDAFEVNKGDITATYDSPYHGDYDIDFEGRITPDGQYMYNDSGYVFELAPLKSGDMVYSFDMGDEFHDFAFHEKLTFAASNYGGIDIYEYNTDHYLYSLKEDVLVNHLYYKDGLIAIYEDESGKNFVEFIQDYKSQPFNYVDGLFLSSDSQGIKPYDFYNGIRKVPADSSFVLQFNQKVNLVDPSTISLKGPNGEIKVSTDLNYGILYIKPQYLYESTQYTLTIGQGAVSGYSGEKLESDRTFTFYTSNPPISNLSVSVNDSQAPLQYTFNASSSGGVEPEYRYSVKANGEWKVIQNYSSSQSTVWRPAANGTYSFKVEVRSKGEEASEKSYEFSQVVKDDIVPSITLVPDKTNPTNGNVQVTVRANDNIGIKNIRLPDGKRVADSNTTFTVTKNGSYFFETEDLLGNVASSTLNVTNIDKISPEASIISSTTTPTKNDIVLVVNANDNNTIKGITLPGGTFSKGNNALFPVSKNGTYTFTVEDMAGNKTTKVFTVLNIYKNPPATPAVNPVWDNHTAITGKAAANSIVTALVGSKIIGTAKATPQGSYKISMVKQKAGTKISLYAKDPAGNKSASRVVTTIDKTPPAAPTVNKITTQTRLITGKAEKGSIVYLYSGSRLVSKSTVDSLGNYKISIQPQRKGTSLKLQAVDKAINKSPFRTASVL
ncbi:Ig-like domain-containing protein [Bacillus sp. V5-8f]|uniref:Ig-like domain-containing protein n=1 Tax=Bacillus sp. V5-8f TaxID=2053044 RepID=UPI000C7778B0|nr:Ig-like domain-containing protein [Bacillus sp. V5-8f]PLT35222.1 hypothetical protein CUU64_07565 [Bacillus sp. V5-8f]